MDTRRSACAWDPSPKERRSPRKERRSLTTLLPPKEGARCEVGRARTDHSTRSTRVSGHAWGTDDRSDRSCGGGDGPEGEAWKDGVEGAGAERCGCFAESADEGVRAVGERAPGLARRGEAEEYHGRAEMVGRSNGELSRTRCTPRTPVW